MFLVSQHAVERYIQRVMGITDLKKDELEDIIYDMGGDIANTINKMIFESDIQVKFKDKETIAKVIYRDIVLVIAEDRMTKPTVVTVFRTHNDYSKDTVEYIEYVNKIKKHILNIQKRKAEIQFQKKHDEFEALEERELQLFKVLSENPLA